MSAESTTPASALPSKQEILAFQQRWMRRAGFAALAGALLVAAGIILQRVGLHLPDTDSDADQLAFAHAHDARSVYTSVLQGIGFCLFAGPLLFLYRSAQWRAQRVRGAFAALVVLGALAFGVGIAISAVGTSQSAGDFVKQEPAVVQQAREQAANAQETAAAPKAKGQATTPTATTAVPTPTPTATGATGATGSTTTPANAAPKSKTPDQAASDAREGLADHLNKHSTILIIGGLISTIGVLGMLFAMIYTNLWAMRLGLFTRFWGALGMAFGLFLLIPLFPPVPGLVLWFAVTGLMFTGLWPRPLPPAWAAGEAIPWQRPGDDLGPPASERDPTATVEGSGREIAEPPLSENGGGNGEPPQPPYGETQGERRKKRKRRR